jgi:hypothetical protein
MKITWATLDPMGRIKFHEKLPDYTDLNRAVGGLLELCPNMTHRRWTVYCNEEGKLLGLSANIPATMLTGLVGFDIICGTVAIIGPPDREGSDTALGEEELKLLTELSGG